MTVRPPYVLAALVSLLAFSAACIAQTAAVTRPTPIAATAQTAVPTLIPYAGVALAQDGKALAGEKSITFLVFKDEQAGEPLWVETQSVALDATGHYQVQLGASSPTGIPTTTFASGEGRWLEVQISGQPTQPRTLLASVPYAMKSADAETLGGLSAQNFVTQSQLAAAAKDLAAQASPQITPFVTPTGSGIANDIPLWTSSTALGNSVMSQGNGNILIGSASTPASLGVYGNISNTANGTYSNFTSTAYNSVGYEGPRMAFDRYDGTLAAPTVVKPNDTVGWFDFFAYDGTTADRVGQFSMFVDATPTSGIVPGRFEIETASSTGVDTPRLIAYSNDNVVMSTHGGKVGIGTGSPAATLEVNGTAKFDGNITFASTQTFPTSVGTITGITTTSPLTGGGTSGSVALGLNTTTLETTLNSVYPQLSAANTFTSGATFGGAISAASATSGTAAITGTGTNGADGITATSDTGNAGNFANNSAPYATVFVSNPASFSSSVNYIPVAINGTTSGTSSIGIYGSGTSSGLWGSSASGMGVWGSSGSVPSVPVFTSTGVLGEGVAPAPGNAGVLGFTGTSESSTYAYEVGNSGMAGVWGDTTGNPTSSFDFSAGVMGTTDALDGYGGVFIANSADAVGMYAKNLNSGTGVFGESVGTGVSNNAGTGGSGVSGFSPSPAKGFAGVIGNVYQVSGSFTTVAGTGPVGFVAGVWGDAGEVNDGSGTYEAGVVGTGDDITAAVFENNSPSGHPTVSAIAAYTGSTQTLFRTFIGTTPEGTCGFGGAGDMTCTGQVKALATTGGGSRKVETYSVQSPENWMEDFGSANLQNGVAVVALEPAYSETVSADATYHVFLTPNGDSKGLYVIRKTATSFEVRESGGGTSSLAFDYRIVAKRRGYEAQRLTDVTERFNTERAQAMPVSHSSPAPVRRTDLISPGRALPAGTLVPRHETTPTHSGPVRVGAGAAPLPASKASSKVSDPKRPVTQPVQ